ncbi:hypothetical protein GF312_04300 [Candidatus Poribacteria bacterium]|nr:hypothetical protein [Candidatus Poribacteria bacterium]
MQDDVIDKKGVEKIKGVTLRSVIIAILIMPLNAYWIIQMEVVWWGFPTIVALFYNVIFILLLLSVLNLLLRKYLAKWALRPGEMLTIYVMLCIATALSGYDMMQCLVSLIGTPVWYATPENEWHELFDLHLPEWLVIKDKDVLRGYFEGDTTLYIAKYLKGWALPVLSWVSFTVVLIFVMLCISIIVRKQWIDNEKLAYPIIQLPNEIIREGGTRSFFGNKLMWMGFSLAGIIDILNGIHHLYPAVPNLPVKLHSIGHLFAHKPWNAMGSLHVSFYPFAIGLAFLMPLDLAFSFWFFLLFWKFQSVLGSIMGWQSTSAFPYPTHQLGGVCIGLLVFALWSGRSYFLGFLKGFSIKDLNQENNKMIRLAFIGLVIGMAFLVLFGHRMGMSVWIAISFFILYLALSTTITRIRAELGPPAHDMYGAGPDHILTTILGTRRMGPGNLTAISLFYWINREAYRTHPMPNILEGFKLAQLNKVNERKLSYAIILAAAVGSISCFWALLHIGHNLGAATQLYGRTWFARAGITRLQNWLSYPTNTDVTGSSFIGVGFLFTIGLMILRTRFIWWPLHPVGYAVTSFFIGNVLWFPVLISSVIKWIILKYGGIKQYRQAVPFFIGLILGEYIVGSLWSLLGILFSMPTYIFWY